MTEAVLGCPSCSGRPGLRILDPHMGFPLPLHRCDRCLGIWANQETVRIARSHYPDNHYVMVEGHGRQTCRSCGRLQPRGGGPCVGCGTDQQIQCAQCARPMTIAIVGGVTLDICKPCQAVWFDRGELGLVTRAHASELHQRLDRRPADAIDKRDAGAQGDSGTDLLSAGVDVVDLGPEVVQGAHAAGEFAVGAVERVPEGLEAVADVSQAAGETAVDAASAAGELAADAADALLGLLGGIFD